MQVPTLSTRARVIAMGILAIAVAGLVFVTPADRQIGEWLKFVLFHGASTWANLTFVILAALASAVFLVRRSTSAFAWAGAYRYFAAPWWLVNTLLGFVSMRFVWGGIKWDDGRLRMSLAVLLAIGIMLLVDLIVGNRRVTAVLDVVLGFVGGTLWVLLTTRPELFESGGAVVHPDNPVFNTSSWEIGASFAGQFALLVLIALLGAKLLRDRLHAHLSAEEASVEDSTTV